MGLDKRLASNREISLAQNNPENTRKFGYFKHTNTDFFAVVYVSAALAVARSHKRKQNKNDNAHRMVSVCPHDQKNTLHR